MTNAERYKNPKEQTKAFREYCSGRVCKECPNYSEGVEIHCAFAWLNQEVEMTGAEVADVLREYHSWIVNSSNDAPYMPNELHKALDRAVELLKGGSNEQK